MPIPDYQRCMLPILRYASDGQEHQLKDAALKLAEEFGLSQEEVSEFLPSGQQPVFINRIGWARTYLKKAGLLLNPRRSYFQITSRGRTVLKENPPEINVKYSPWRAKCRLERRVWPLAGARRCEAVE